MGIILLLQVISQKSVGTVGIPDLIPGHTVDGVAHSIAHPETQKTSPVRRVHFPHLQAPPSFLYIIYIFHADCNKNNAMQGRALLVRYRRRKIVQADDQQSPRLMENFSKKFYK